MRYPGRLVEESGGRGKGSCGSDKQQKKKGRGKVSEGKGREKRACVQKGMTIEVDSGALEFQEGLAG